MSRGAAVRALAVAALLLAGLPTFAAEGTSPAVQPEPAGAQAGTSSQSSGTWTWTDYVYDDGRRLDNAADVVSTSVTPHGDDLRITVVLNTLRPGDAPVLGLALSSPSDRRRRAWPLGAGVTSPWRSFVTVTRTHTSMTGTDGRSRALPAPSVDAKQGSLSFVIPGWGKGSVVSAVLGAGRWDGRRWAADGVVDLAFNSAAVESRVAKDGLNDAQQQRAIAARDVGRLAAAIDLRSLRAGRTRRAPVSSGVQVRVFRSVQALGGGYGAAFPETRGSHQPYTVYVPPRYDPSHPACLAVVLHSSGHTHNEYAPSRLYPELAGDRGCVAVTPLALGREGWYWDEALVDTLQVLLDVQRAFPVDRDRITLTGYSMGGYGAYRLATLLPDLFAAGAVWSAATAFSPSGTAPARTEADPLRNGPGWPCDMLESTTSLPLLVGQGTHDVAARTNSAVVVTQRMKELGHTYRLDVYAGYDHGAFGAVDRYEVFRDWLGTRRRVLAPPQVFALSRPMAWADPARPEAVQHRLRDQLRPLVTALGGAMDGAYWVQHVVPEPGAGDVMGRVQLTSGGIAYRVATTREVREAHPGAPYVVGSPAQLGPPYAHVLTGQDRVLSSAPVQNTLTGTLSVVRSAVVDLRRANLHLDGLKVSVTSDTPATLTLVEGQRRHTVRIPATSEAEPFIPNRATTCAVVG